MLRFKYRQLIVATPAGLVLQHVVWDDMYDKARCKLGSKYACKLWIRNNQEEIEETE